MSEIIEVLSIVFGFMVFGFELINLCMWKDYGDKFKFSIFLGFDFYLRSL